MFPPSIDTVRESFGGVGEINLYNVVKIHALVAIIRAYPHDVALISHDIDQAELLEE